MRKPDIAGEWGKAWKVPLDRARTWVLGHPELMHQSARGDAFIEVWRDLWYVRAHVQEDLVIRSYWRAVILRDLRVAPAAVPRIYREAEWEVVVLECDPPKQTPPINGDGLFSWDTADPDAMLFNYQLHGLTDDQVLRLGGAAAPITFAQYVVEALVNGWIDVEATHRLSRIVNGIREHGFGEPPRRPLAIADRSGYLVELEDGKTISLPTEAIPEGERR